MQLELDITELQAEVVLLKQRLERLEDRANVASSHAQEAGDRDANDFIERIYGVPR